MSWGNISSSTVFQFILSITALFLFTLTSSSVEANATSSPIDTPATHDISKSDIHSIKLTSDSSQISVGHLAHYYIAPEQQKTIDEIISLPSSLWEKSQQEVPSFSLTSGDIWLWLKLENQEAAPLKKIIHLDYALLDYLEVFYQQGSRSNYSRHYQTGSIYPFSTRPINDSAFAFPVTLEANQSLNIYLRIQNDGFVQTPIALWNEVTFYEHRQFKLATLFAFVGVIFALGLYNIFLYFSVGERPYLLFAILAISTSLIVSISSGISIQFLDLDLYTCNKKWLTIFIGSMTISGSLLPISVINVKPISKVLHYLCITIAWLGAWVLLSALLLNHTTRIGIAFAIALISILIIVYLSFYLWFKKVAGIRLFAISWCLFLLGATSIIFNRLGLIPRNDSTEYLLVYTSLFGLFLLSFSLANRINTTKKQQQDAQATSLQMMERFYELYQHSLEGIFTITEKGELLEANPAFCRMLGYTDFTSLKHALKPGRVFSVSDLVKLLKKVRDTGKVQGYELKGQRANGDDFWAAIYLRRNNQVHKSVGVLAGTILDISDFKESQLKLEYLAEHDPLTGLYNRRKFMTALGEAITHYRVNKLQSTVIYLDLDQFKVVNDTCGHTAGDKLLKELTHIMSELIPLGSCLARLGGDEFAVVLNGYDEESSFDFSENMRQTINNFEFMWNDQLFSLGASIGIVRINKDCNSVEYVLSLADTACFAAKDQGRNCIHIYDHQKGEAQALKSEMHRVTEIKYALEHNNFQLFQQAIVPSDTAEYSDYYEILIRMTNKANEIIPPGLFLPAAERYNLMPNIDCWVVENYCVWLSHHRDHLEKLKRASINLSTATVNDPATIKFICGCFEKFQIPKHKICFEVTESSAIINMDKTLPLLRSLRDQGFNLALDDFGSGFASYGYLKTLPFNVLKIDGCFIRDIANNHIDQTMVKSINEVAKALGMDTVAEFVENDTVLDIIRNIGVQYSQGYGIAKPEPIHTLIADH